MKMQSLTVPSIMYTVVSTFTLCLQRLINYISNALSFSRNTLMHPCFTLTVSEWHLAFYKLYQSNIAVICATANANAVMHVSIIGTMLLVCYVSPACASYGSSRIQKLEARLKDMISHRRGCFRALVLSLIPTRATFWIIPVQQLGLGAMVEVTVN